MNEVILIANLGDNPEMRTTKAGKNYAYIRVCTSENYQDSNGEWQTSKEWHTLKIYDQSRDRAVNTLKKGDLIQVQGSLKSFKGEKCRLWEVKVRSWRNLSGLRRGSGVERPNDFLLPREPLDAFETNEHTPIQWGEGFTRR